MNHLEFKEIIQSSHLNFLIGAGASYPFLPLLNDIERKLRSETDQSKRIAIYREYFEKVMVPNLKIVNGTVDKATGSDFEKTYSAYERFFELVTTVLLERKSTILSKQANVFTTNIDILMESLLEDGNLEYNDGFSGRLNPTFSLSNFKKSVSKRSLHFENVSEIPVINLVKMHGSLTWERRGEKLVLSRLRHIDQLDAAALTNTDEEFLKMYEQIAIVNPEPKKFQETVIDLIYYELLRLYSSELEKENTVLIVIGFSMADEHIREITIRSANSNPTLKIYIICHSHAGMLKMQAAIALWPLKYSNVELIGPEDDKPEHKYDLRRINDVILSSILSPKNEGDGE